MEENGLNLLKIYYLPYIQQIYCLLYLQLKKKSKK